ncbi:MAG: phosphoribosylamine--glycine ligase [Chitinophagaceae bacterium]|jgi:phosphoribosylamine--glycine ligase|nr:phosphoribosylamine--glycine ligase [Chitinophagaceae bacterium]
MHILLLGSGGREHAFAWRISQSPLCTRLFIAPGNAGTMACGTNVSLDPVDFASVKSFCLSEEIGMVVVGPEEPLVRGIYDFFKSDPQLWEIPVIGPSREAAQLEGSKAFAKAFMTRHGIPTASYREFDNNNYTEGVDYLQRHATPIVLKADGLAAGKGVIIAQNHVEAMAEFELMIQQSKFGEAGHKVVVEEFLTGVELSMFVLTDGKGYLLFPEAKDYKRIGEGDTGLNTGGMGAVSPVPFADSAFMEKVRTRIIDPTIQGLQQEGLDYKGFIFFGLISVGGEPYVIEYNCRMGDPETEVVLPRIKNDLVALFKAVAQGRLQDHQIDIDPRAAATVMLVSGGYPGNYEKGYEISGLDILNEDDVLVFHAGTQLANGRVVTHGGRVLAVTAYGGNITEAVKRSLKIIEFIEFEGMYFRSDIGYEFR